MLLENGEEIELSPVSSTNINAFGYKIKNKSDRQVIDAYIQFITSQDYVYKYLDIEEESFNNWQKAPSLGKFFQAEIRGVYLWQKLKIVPEKR